MVQYCSILMFIQYLLLYLIVTATTIPVICPTQYKFLIVQYKNILHHLLQMIYYLFVFKLLFIFLFQINKMKTFIFYRAQYISDKFNKISLHKIAVIELFYLLTILKQKIIQKVEFQGLGGHFFSVTKLSCLSRPQTNSIPVEGSLI